MNKKRGDNTGIDLDIVQEETHNEDSISISKKGKDKGKKSLLQVKDLEEDKLEESPDTDNEQESEEDYKKNQKNVIVSAANYNTRLNNQSELY